MWKILVCVAALLSGLSASGQTRHWCPGCPEQVTPAITSQTPNYTITITPPSGPLSLRSPLLVEMFYTNTTTSTLEMDCMLCRTCTADQLLLTKDGKEVEPTAWQRMTTGRGLPSDYEGVPPVTATSRVSRFPPGIFWKVNLNLRTFYSITEPGQYLLSASRTEYVKSGKVVVRSNTVTLNIVP